MRKYVKPIAVVNSNVAEGVYAASGCYSVTTSVHQANEFGRNDFRVQINAQHNADHTREAQTLTITFDNRVSYVQGGAGYIGGNKTNTLIISLSYHQNPSDNIGLGDLIVQAEDGVTELKVQSVQITD